MHLIAIILPFSSLLLLFLAVARAEAIAEVKARQRPQDILKAMATADILEPIPARVDVPPANQTLKAGESVELSCETFGAPPPTIRWLKNGKKIAQVKPFEEGNIIEQISNSGLETYEQGSTKSRLRIPCLSPKDVGVYTCVAENAFKIETANATVKMVDSNDVGPLCLHKKTCKLRALSDGVLGAPATIYMWTSYRVERQGANVQLYCRAKGNPMPRIAWFLAGEKEGELSPITNGDVFQILRNGDLMVKGQHVQNACTAPGCEFVCVASNIFGVDKAETYLYATELETEGDTASSEKISTNLITEE